MSVLTSDAEVFARSSGMKRRRHLIGTHSRAAMIASFILLPGLGGCSFGPSDSASLSRQTAANQTAANMSDTASRGSPAPAVATPPLSIAAPENAGVPGVPSRTASPIYAANASAPPVAPPASAANASAPAAANAAVPSAPPPAAGNASAAPGTSAQSPQPTENPFYAIYNSLKDNGPQCAMPTEPCDNIHRIQN